MIHRHLEDLADAPVTELPSAAIVDILDRGDLDAWRPIAAEVAKAPFGDLAERVHGLVTAYPMYGTSALWRAWIDRCRARHEGPLRGSASSLRELRSAQSLTQTELAARIGMSQSDLSKLERRRDVRVSTLRAFVEALGGDLELVCVGPSGRTRIRVGPLRAG